MVGTGVRSFEQLLARQLGEEGEVVEGGGREEEEARAPRPFLRRGQGLTRFNLPADPRLQPSMIRTRARPKPAETKSRLGQETQSFANKKTAPEDRHYIPAARPSPSPTVRSLQPPKPSPPEPRPSLRPSPATASPPVRLKLKSPTKVTKLAKGEEVKPLQGEALKPPRTESLKPRKSEEPKPGRAEGSMSREKPRGGAPRPSTQPSHSQYNDSVENSFREKLSVQERKAQKDLKELAVFELLEDAANDSSFCSTSSRVKTLMQGSVLPSPHRGPAARLGFTSSTPAQGKEQARAFTSQDQARAFTSSTPALARDSARAFTASTPATAVSGRNYFSVNMKSLLLMFRANPSLILPDGKTISSSFYNYT